MSKPTDSALREPVFMMFPGEEGEDEEEEEKNDVDDDE